MKLTYETVELVSREEAKVEVFADELPFNMLQALGITEPGMATVDVFFNICFVEGALIRGTWPCQFQDSLSIVDGRCTFVFGDKAITRDVEDFFNQQALEHDFLD